MYSVSDDSLVRSGNDISSSEVFWPQDLLPNDRPDVRILTWGYDTVVTKGWQRANKNNLFAHAKDFLYALERVRPSQRPIVFVAHSLGGIMVKEVLRRSELSSENSVRDIICSTSAIIFMGTPHRGSPGLANLGEVVRRTASTVLRVDSNATILRTLGCDSPELELCRESFAAQWRRFDFRVKTFQEALAIGGVGIGRYSDKVVPDTSSLLDDEREHAETIGANHMEMARFCGSEDVGYQKVAGEIRVIIERIYQIHDGSMQHPHGPVAMPNRTAPSMHSQLDEMTRLHANGFNNRGKEELMLNQQHVHLRPRIVEPSAPTSSHSGIAPLGTARAADRHQPVFSDTEKECLQYFSFTQLGARQQNIKPELEGTCMWIFNHANYREWEARQQVGTHRGILWVKGKPGAGKSVVMKKILQTIEDRELPGSIVASFFFNARGAELERNTRGMSQSLLHQILQQDVGMRQDFQRIYLKRKATRGVVKFEELELRGFLMRHLTKPINIPVYILIDALDECKEEEVRDVVDYLRELTDLAYDAGNKVSVCMSSRRYPTISVARCPEIDVEDGNRSDVTRYVYQKIRRHADGSMPETLATSIDSKASHVFLWAVLVVEMVLRGWDAGVPPHELETMLSRIPQEIDQVFDGLSQTLTVEERPETLRLFQWVLLSVSPLNLGSLQYALIFGRDRPPPSFAAVHIADGPFKSQQLIRRITHYSRGLLEVVKTDSAYVVQVIHESVRDWFFSAGGFSCMDPTLSSEPIGKGHIEVLRTCINILTTSDLWELHPLQANIPRGLGYENRCEGTYWSSHVRNGIGLNSCKKADVIGITQYCADNIFKHVQCVEDHGMVPEAFLNTILESNSKLWANLLHVVTADDELRYHHSTHNVLTLLCRKGLSNSVSWALQTGGGKRLRDLSCNAVRACILGAHLDTLKVLDSYQCIRELTDADGRNGLHWSCIIYAHAQSYFSLIKSTLTGLIEFFLERDVSMNSKDKYGTTALMMAVPLVEGSTDIVQYLIGLGAFVDARDNDGRTALHIAVEHQKLFISEELLKQGASADIQDVGGQIVLHKTAALGRESLTTMLLKYTKNINLPDTHGATPLHLAALSGDGKIVCRLVLAGADLNKADETGQTVLHIGARKISYGTLEMILDKGADRTLKDRFGMTASDHAEANGRGQEIVNLLDPDR